MAKLNMAEPPSAFTVVRVLVSEMISASVPFISRSKVNSTTQWFLFVVDVTRVFFKIGADATVTCSTNISNHATG